MKLKRGKPAYVIASQGHPQRYLGKFHFQPWVENVNTLLRAFGFQTVVFSAGDHIGSYYSNDKMYEVVIHKKAKFFNDYFSVFLSFRMLVSRKPAFVVIHGLQHFLTLTALALFGLLRRTPLLIIVHGMYETGHPISLLRDKSIKSLLLLFNRTNTPWLLVSLTEFDKRNLKEKWGFTDTNIAVSPFPLYISLDEITALSKAESTFERKPRNYFTFLFIGRLSEEKGIDKIIHALNIVHKKGFNARLIIVGGGPLKQKITSLVNKLQLNDAVRIEGIASREKKWDFYLKSDSLVLASKHEGFPRVILEAFATGKSIIAPRICGIPEVIVHGKNGFLFKNKEELVKFMTESIEKPDLVRKIGEYNKKTVLKRMILETSASRDFSQIISQLGISS